MRKILLNRSQENEGKGSSCTRNRQSCRIPLPLPRRTLLNNWNVRNDSSNVNAVLHPEHYLQSPRTHIGEHQKKPLAHVKRKCCLSTNTCYCREKGPKPKILARPRTCLTAEELEKRRIPLSNFSRRPLKECICAGPVRDTEDLTDAEVLQLYKDKVEDDGQDIQLTEQRKDYELYRSEETENDLEELRKLEEYQHQKQQQPLSISTIMPTNYGDSVGGYTDAYPEEPMDIAEMRKFRNQHYFETHGEEVLGKDVPQHACVHQYQLDHRFLPVPVNPDIYGRSRCTICSRPMKEDKDKTSKYRYEDMSSTPTLKTFSKFYQSGLVPRTICFGKDGTKIELKVDEEELKKLDCFIGKLKMPEYKNSFALRQQKMKYY